MDERKSLKLNIQRTTICILVVLSLLIGVSAASVPSVDRAVKLSDIPFYVVNNNDGTDTVFHEFPINPIWQWEITNYDTGTFVTEGPVLDVTGQAGSAGPRVTGFLWPAGAIVDVRDLSDDAFATLEYAATFFLDVPGETEDFSAWGALSLTPRYRLLNENGNQIAMVNGNNIRVEFDTSTDYGGISLPLQGSQSIDLLDGTAYIDVKWQFNTYISGNSQALDFALYLEEMDFFMSYDRDHVVTDSELAAKLNDEVGKISGDLAAAGDAFNSVPKPDIDDVMKPIDEILPQQGMSQLSGAIGLIANSSFVATQFAILGVILLVSYVLFGKKEAGG